MVSPVVVGFSDRRRIVGQEHVAVVAIMFLEGDVKANEEARNG